MNHEGIGCPIVHVPRGIGTGGMVWGLFAHFDADRIAFVSPARRMSEWTVLCTVPNTWPFYWSIVNHPTGPGCVYRLVLCRPSDDCDIGPRKSVADDREVLPTCIIDALHCRPEDIELVLSYADRNRTVALTSCYQLARRMSIHNSVIRPAHVTTCGKDQ